ncbi:hypothetical protein NIES3807_38570 [Microcystis aeruginosa NIES-3807]|uniref:Uncharacterized protein n=1 Tax=Microcystis aeruginosa NIES-3807 TaxID=2517785 RepID=A0AAD3B3T6_MICAE|nr:hypothetical protein NIES3807_38570 [Microcystis aeruginosa NIES-3807]
MNLPIQSQPVVRTANITSVSGLGINLSFFCPFGCGVVNCGQGRHCVDTGFMSCDCVNG